MRSKFYVRVLISSTSDIDTILGQSEGLIMKMCSRYGMCFRDFYDNLSFSAF